MFDREIALKWMGDKIGRVTYSMINRNGAASYDCSSSIYYALIASGNLPSTTRIGNTDSLFGDLEKHGWTKLAEDKNGNIDTQRGDIFIWGERGQSSGAFGHTGMFVDSANIINCNYGYNGMVINNHDWLYSINGSPVNTIYRYTGTQVASNDPVDQIIEVGSWVKFEDAYTANDVQLIGNTWQVRTDQLCKTNFTWDDNGIPAAVLTEVDKSGYATSDQELNIGSLYKIAGKFHVLDVGQDSGNWIAQVGAGGMTFWVDIETATEVTANDAGTAQPAHRQDPVIVPPLAPNEPKTPETLPPAPVPTPAPTPVPVPPTVENTPVIDPTKLPVLATDDGVGTALKAFFAALATLLKKWLNIR